MSAACPLRVWLVSQSYLPYQGGITEHVWHLSGELAARGHRVTILTGRPTGNGHAPIDPDPPGVRVLRVGRTVRVPSHGARACVTLGWHWRARLLASAAEMPEVVHLQSPLEPFLPLWALRHAPGVKVGTFHTGGRRSHWGYRRFAPWLQRQVHRLDVRIGVSQEAARFAARHFPGDYAVIPNGIDLRRFSLPPTEGAGGGGDTPRPPRILFVGRLDPRKGLAVLLRAFSGLHSDRALPPGTRLVLVGDGPCRGELQRAARARALPIEFAGGVARAALPRYYREADLFVAPSTDGESFGVSLLEALAAGLPLLAADIPGYRETLHGLRTARFFTAGSPAALARALRAWIRRPPRREALAAEQRDFVSRYAWARVAGTIEDLYRNALARTATGKRLR